MYFLQKKSFGHLGGKLVQKRYRPKHICSAYTICCQTTTPHHPFGPKCCHIGADLLIFANFWNGTPKCSYRCGFTLMVVTFCFIFTKKPGFSCKNVFFTNNLERKCVCFPPVYDGFTKTKAHLGAEKVILVQKIHQKSGF